MREKNNRYSDETKKAVVTEYLNGAPPRELVRKYDLKSSTQVFDWRDRYLTEGSFTDRRGGSRVHIRSVRTDDMTKDEYIAYLEMENDILKRMRSLNSSRAK